MTLRSTGYRPFPLDWCPSGHSRLLSSRILSRGGRPLPLHPCPAVSSRLVSGRPLSIDFRPYISTCFRPVPLGWSPPRCTRRRVAVYPHRQGENTEMLVLGYARTMETLVHATAAVAGRPRVSQCSGRPSMLYPVGEPPRRSPHPPHNARRRRPFGQHGHN